MKTWLRRIRGAAGMGLTWAAGWALVGVLIGLSMFLGLPIGWFVEVFDALFPSLIAVASGTASVAAAAVIIGTVTLLSAISASGSLALARMAEDRELLGGRG
ncbi:MAG: hypothetical protein BMS9Abin29_2410 [Gemmatimonadota bacterium]|nr:MAG: hypothetical protein BMS9Abin29_2410 [Gemmatimonadota bacterium]